MRAAIASLCVVVFAGSASAETLNFDFRDGIDPNFVVRKDDPGWTVGTDSTGLRIHWNSTQSGLFPSSAGAGGYGGLVGNFFLGGDFTVTVDYALNEFATEGYPWVLFDSVMVVGPEVPGVPPVFEVLRFSTGNVQAIEIFEYDESSFRGDGFPNSDTYGRYRLSRTGSVVSGYYATGDSPVFNYIGSNTISLEGQLRVSLVGFFSVRYSDPQLSMDISFNNLVIEADSIEGYKPIPEPASVLLVGSAVALMIWSGRRVRRII